MNGGNQINKKGRAELKRRRRAAGLVQFKRQVTRKMKQIIASGNYRKTA